MSNFDDAIEKAKDVLNTAGKKTSEVVGIQKLKLRIVSLKSDVQDDYAKLGEMYYDASKCNKELDGSVSEIIAKIDENLAKIEDIKKQIAAAKGAKICLNCGESVDVSADFCPKCGNKF